jgi:hypothetical protein
LLDYDATMKATERAAKEHFQANQADGLLPDPSEPGLR